MTLIYPLNDRADLSNLMTAASSRLITPVEIAQVRLCRPSVYDRKYQCVIMWSGMTSCLCIYTNVRGHRVRPSRSCRGRRQYSTSILTAARYDRYDVSPRSVLPSTSVHQRRRSGCGGFIWTALRSRGRATHVLLECLCLHVCRLLHCPSHSLNHHQ